MTEELAQGDFVKVRVGNERIWFEVLTMLASDGVCNAVICRLANIPQECVFDGRVTIDREWIIDTNRKSKPNLRVVSGDAP